MSTPEQRAAAFQSSQAILALENMVEPADFAELRQAVIDGTLTFDEAVIQLVAQAKSRNGASPAA